MRAPLRTISLLHIPSLEATSGSSSSPDISGLSDFVLDKLRRLEGATEALTVFLRWQRSYFQNNEDDYCSVPVVKQSIYFKNGHTRIMCVRPTLSDLLLSYGIKHTWKTK